MMAAATQVLSSSDATDGESRNHFCPIPIIHPLRQLTTLRLAGRRGLLRGWNG
jgi:hypothetical protein